MAVDVLHVSHGSPAELKSIRSNIIAERLKQYHKQSTTFHENQKVVKYADTINYIIIVLVIKNKLMEFSIVTNITKL